MAFLAAPGVARPSLSARLAVLLDRGEWLFAVLLAAVLTSGVLLAGPTTGGERTGSRDAYRDTGACGLQTFPALHYFFLTLH